MIHKEKIDIEDLISYPFKTGKNIAFWAFPVSLLKYIMEYFSVIFLHRKKVDVNSLARYLIRIQSKTADENAGNFMALKNFGKDIKNIRLRHKEIIPRRCFRDLFES